MGKRLEAAGARRVKLKVEGIDVLVGKQVRRHRVVAALKGVGGVVVAAADVSVDHEVCRLALQGGVVDGHAQPGDLLDVHRAHAGLCHEVAVAVDAPGAVVKLHVAATGGVEVGQHRAIGGGNVGDELLVGGVDRAQALLLAVAAVQDDLGVGLGRRRDGLTGHLPLLFERLHKLEVFHKRVALARDLARDHGRVGGGLLVVELVTRARGATLDALEPPHEVQVPVAAAELAIGDDVQARRLLLGNQVADGLVLDGAQGAGVDDAGGKVGARLLEHVRTKEAADHVGAEGCVLDVGHVWLLSCVCLTRRESARDSLHRELPNNYHHP